jgi:hypothetical protein
VKVYVNNGQITRIADPLNNKFALRKMQMTRHYVAVLLVITCACLSATASTNSLIVATQGHTYTNLPQTYMLEPIQNKLLIISDEVLSITQLEALQSKTDSWYLNAHGFQKSQYTKRIDLNHLDSQLSLLIQDLKLHRKKLERELSNNIDIAPTKGRTSASTATNQPALRTD